MKELLKKYCNAFGPSGLEDEIRNLIIEDIKPYATKYKVDQTGNIIAFKKGKNRRNERMLLSAHMDEVGFMINYLSDEGFAYFETIGGIDPRVISGKHVVIGDKRINGVLAAKAIHLQTHEEIGVPEKIDKMFIDFGCVSKEDSEKHVKIGDCAVFAPFFEEFGNGYIKSKAIDDRFGCAVLVKLLQSDLDYDTYFAFCTSEEVGCRGSVNAAQQIKADKVIVIEATTAGDIAGTPDHKKACCLKEGAVISYMDGGTIYPKECVDRVLATAKECKIKAQLKNLVAGGNDARSYQRTAAGAKVIAISAPVRYLHSSSSVAYLDDLEQVYKLTAETAKRSF